MWSVADVFHFLDSFNLTLLQKLTLKSTLNILL